MDIIERISINGSDKEQIVKEAIKSPECIPKLLEGLHHEKGSVKLGCEKILRLISEKQPELIYPYFDTFVKMLDSENNILKWGAIITISNLSSVDTESKIEEIFNKYYYYVTDKTMITASNIVKNSWKIALAKPKLAGKITNEILKAEHAAYVNKGRLSPECNNVVCGHAIEAFEKFYAEIKDKKPVVDFIKRQAHNTRKPVARKAEKFLSKYRIDM
jgi:hypothetical protein